MKNLLLLSKEALQKAAVIALEHGADIAAEHFYKAHQNEWELPAWEANAPAIQKLISVLLASAALNAANVAQADSDLPPPTGNPPPKDA